MSRQKYDKREICYVRADAIERAILKLDSIGSSFLTTDPPDLWRVNLPVADKRRLFPNSRFRHSELGSRIFKFMNNDVICVYLRKSAS